MPLTQLSNTELADKLLEPQVDASLLKAASERLRSFELQQLLTMNEVVSAVAEAPTIKDEVSRTVESVVMAIPLSKKTSTQMSSLAARILRGAPYDDQDVKSLAASVLTQDETPGQ